MDEEERLRRNRESKTRWRQLNPIQHWAATTHRNARIRASKRGIPYNLTSTYIRFITPTHCPVFGFPFAFGGNKYTRYNSATLDRLDAIKGYIVGNVVVISSKANVIKNAYTSADVLQVGKWLQGMGL